MTDKKAELAKKAIIAGKTQEQFLSELPSMTAAELREYGKAYEQMCAYRDEICSDEGSTFE
jgi:hypothetical protein